MNPAATWVEAERQMAQDVLESNLRHLRVPERSREKVRETTSDGELVSMPDGSLGLSVSGALLGVRSALSTRSLMKGVSGDADTAVVVFGLGTGHTVQELRSRVRGPVIVFDPDPSVVRATLQSGPSGLGGVHLSCDMDELKMWWPTFSSGRSAATLVTTPGYAERYSGIYEGLKRELGVLINSAKVNETTLHVRARSWIDNILVNLPRVVGTRAIGLLRGSFQNVPAFIVGAGPCVSKNAHLLKEASRKGIVFGLNSSASVLAAHDTEPQVVVCLEALNTASQLASLPWLGRVNRAMSLSASPATWALPGHVMPYYEQISFFSALRSLLGVDPTLVAGSVSTAAFSMAEMMGCSPIVFVGQDLAFTDGRVHAAGTEIESSRVRVDRDAGCIMYDWCEPAKRMYKDLSGGPSGERLSEVTAWGGEGMVVSSATWNLVRQWLESRALQLRSNGDERGLINATEGGSRISGFEEVPLGDVLANLDEVLVTSESMRQEATRVGPAVSAENLHAWVGAQSARAQEARLEAQVLAGKVQDAIDITNTDDPTRVGKAYAGVSDAEHVLKRSVRAQPMLEAWCQADIDDLLKGRQQSEQADALFDAQSGLETELGVARVIGTAAKELETKLTDVSGALQPMPRSARR